MSCHLLLQGIFPTQELNPHLLLGKQILYLGVTWEAMCVYVYVCVCVCVRKTELLCYRVEIFTGLPWWLRG